MRASRRLLGLAAATLAGGVIASCDDPTRPPTVGEIAPRIALVMPDSATLASLVLPLTAVRAQVIGPTSKIVDLTLVGSSWTGKASGLSAGDYQVIIEGLAAGEVQFYGRVPSVSVVRGATASPFVSFAAAVPVVDAPPLLNTTNFSQRIPFSAIPAATAYSVQVSQSSTFASGNIEFVTTETNPIVTVTGVGTWYVRTRATLPGTSSPVPWSDSRTFQVFEALGGRTEDDATSVPVDPLLPDTLSDRNLTPDAREDWFDFAVRAGDSLFIETVAARLSPPSALNTVLTLFHPDAVTQIATDDNGTGTADSRIVAVAPVTDTLKIRVTAPGGTSGHYELVREIRRLPAAPTALGATVVSGTQVDLAWTDNADNESQFVIERCIGDSCTNFAEVATVLSNVVAYSTNTLTQGLDYRWRVRARNSRGTSAPTNIVLTSTAGPAAPTTLGATTISATRIDLAWTDNATNELGYRVRRCTGVDCTPTTTEIAELGPGATSHSDSTVVFGQSYTYHVIAYNNVMESTPSAPATANTFPPATPSSLVATVAGATRITLAWTDNASDELGFRVERCTGDTCTDFTEIAVVGVNVTAHVDSVGLAFNTGYRYRVRAFHAVTGVAYSNIANADTRPPTAPTSLTATTAPGPQVGLNWTDTSDDEIGFVIERCVTGGCTNFAAIDTVAAGVVGFADTDVVVGESYSYRVFALGVPGNSAVSNVASTNTNLPGAPSGLSATTVSAFRIDLAWTDGSTNETGFEVQRCDGVACDTFVSLATLGAGVQAHEDSTAAPGLSFTYRVRAVGVVGNSGFSNEATANTFAPADPSGLTATTISGSRIDLAWVNNAPEATEMRIERCSGVGCSGFVEIDVVPAAQTTYQNLGGAFPVALNETYSYRVRAQNVADVSGYSNTATAHTIQPSAPTLMAVTVSASQIDLSWTASTPDVTGYEVERCTNVGCTNFLFLGGTSTLLYSDATVSAGNDYRYRVRAVNVVGPGPYSNTADVNTRTPAAPTGLVATTMVGIVRLTWTDNADNELGVIVERCAGAACVPVELIVLTTIGIETWDDSSVVANTEYTYLVKAYNSAGTSVASSESYANTLIADQVTVLSATAVSPTQIDLAWTPSASQGTGLILNYNVYRCDGACDPATGALLVSLPADSAAYEDTSVEADSGYTYAVVPRTAFGETPIPGSATAFASTKLPAAPSNLVGTLMSPSSIQLAWTDNSGNETHFEVAQCAGVGCTNFVTVASPGAGVTTFLADTLTFDVRYRFIVRAVNTAGSSAWSDTLEIGTTVPAVPTDLEAYITDGSGNIRLLWTDASDNESGFEIDYCVGADCESWVLLTAAAANTTQLDLGSLGANTFRFRIRATNAAGTSAPSAFTEITGDGPYAAPIGTIATTTGPTSILITWSDQTNNETIFRILRCTGGSCDPLMGTVVDSVARDVTSFDDTSVGTGALYRYVVVAVNGFGELASAAFDGHTMLPDAPGTLSATTISSAEIALAWTDGGPFETGYVIERCQGGGCTGFAVIDTVPANFVSFNDTGLSANATYRYRVQAINAVGASAYSNIAEKATDIPATPTDLSALAMTTTRIDLAWTDNATNEDFYIVERCAGTCDASGTFVQIETGLAPNAQAYTDNGVSAGQTYSYRVQALNAGGASPYTNIATATAAAPIDPTDLTATTLSGTMIALTWTDNATNELSYQIERCTSATCPTFTLRKTLAPDATGYVDTVAVDDTYTYRVRAVNNVGASGYTSEESANTLRPFAASGFTAVTVSGTRIDLSWTDNAADEDGYVIERCSGVGCSDFAILDSLPVDASGYQNDGIATETSFTYRLYGYNVAGPSDITGPVTATTITPAAPTSLAAVLAAPGQIDLSWTDNADNELHYRVERCSAGTSKCATADSMNVYAVEIATLGPDAVSYSDAGLAPATLYFYRVRATNTAGSSPYSAIVSRSTSVPPAPTGLVAVTILATRIDLTWTDASANEDGFRVERCIGPDPCTSFTQIVELPANTTSHVDSTLTAGLEVWYRVLAFNGGGANASGVVSATTIVPATPSDFSAVASGQATVNLGWVDNASDEAGFYLERCTGLDCSDFVPLDTLAIDAVAYADLAVTADNVYRYRLRAFGNGHSGYTPIASVATILPNAVTDLVATAMSDTRVDLSWTDNTSTDSLWNETEFAVYRCAGVSCTPTVLHASVGRDTTFFSDSLLPPAETFSYHIVALNLAGAAAPSNVATAATTVPAIPTSLADSTLSATEVLLTWVDNAGNETGYEIERCEGGTCTDFAPVDTAAANEQSRVMGGLVGTSAYRFRVRAFNASGSSGYSNIVLARSDVPPAPTALVGATVSPTQVALAWADNAENETAYVVERCDGTGCGGFVVIDSLAADVTSYQDLSIAIDTVYRYRVRASNIVGPSPYTAEIAVSTYRPATPTDLAATPISATRVDLTWTDVAVNDTVIIVERCFGLGCSSFADIDSLAPDATAYSDTTVTVNNTYNYRLRAENAAGASAPTDSVEVGTFIPSDPSGLTAVTNSATEITLTWVDNSGTDELDFLIERCVGAGCTVFDSLAVVLLDVVTYQDATASLGNEYSYRVIARGGGGNSAPSNVATAHTFPAGDVTALTASPLTSTTLQLAWSAAEFVTSYQIATVIGSDTTLFATVSASVTDTVVTVTTGQVYNFVVRAGNAAGSGAYAGAEVAMTPPPAPVDLTVFPLTTSQASLAWGDTSARETGFEVERAFFSSGSFGSYSTVATLGADVTAHIDEVSAATGRYKYRVRAVNQIGAGDYSNEVDLTLTAPLAPSGLSAAVTAPGQITLLWTDNSDNEQSFSIERSVGNNLSFAQIATVGPGLQSHVDSSGLTINTTYFYRVRAINSIGASGYTNEASTATTVPNAVTSMTTLILSSTSIQVNWDGSGTTGELGFRIYRCVGSSCTDFTLLDGSLPADASTYADVAAAYGNIYRYQARPYNIAGEPSSNPTVQRALVLPTPFIQVALPVNRTDLRVRWNAAPFTWETDFEIEQCAGLTCSDFAPLATLAADDSTYVSTGLPANGAWHRYRVRAVADGNLGPWSNLFSTHTPKEVTLGDTLVTVTSPELVSINMTHYVVAMPAGSPTVEVSIGEDPGGTTSNGGTFLLVQRSKPIERPANEIFNTGALVGDTLCAPGVFTRSSTAPHSVTCSLPQLGVTTDYYITTYSNPYTNLFLSALPGPTTYGFNNCTQTGRLGPVQGQCDAAYAGTSLAAQVVVADSGFQDWTVPFSGRWAVVATGAAGAAADPARLGGRGARIYGEFVLTAGQNLRVAVGQMGSGAGTSTNGGGGGGSFVYDLTGATPMLIAGGGGGTRAAVDQNGCDASTTVFGTIASGDATTTPCTVKVTDAGLGGIVSSGSWGSAGAGFNGNGADDFDEPLAGGRSWANFILGGRDAGCGSGDGGFGGAGSGYGCYGGGGGGGYSGGDGGRVAGGGGSFNAGTNTAAVVGVGTAHGTVILKYLGPVD
ncbi:MAG: hypothetical protein WD771_06260 [Gemmatimonadaceae bacterium]